MAIAVGTVIEESREPEPFELDDGKFRARFGVVRVAQHRRELGLAEGSAVTAVIKASDVIVAVAD